MGQYLLSETNAALPLKKEVFGNVARIRSGTFWLRASIHGQFLFEKCVVGSNATDLRNRQALQLTTWADGSCKLFRQIWKAGKYHNSARFRRQAKNEQNRYSRQIGFGVQ